MGDAPPPPPAAPPAPSPEFGYAHAPILSFYARPLYQDVARRWRGTGLGYLLFLTALLAIPDAARLQVELNRALSDETPRALKDIPTLTVKAGGLSAEVDQPATILEDPTTHQPLIVLDTTGTITSLDATPARALFLKDRILMRRADNSVGETSLATLDDLTLDPVTVITMLGAARRLMVLVAYPMGVLFSFGWGVLVVLLLTWAARMMVQRIEGNVATPVLMRLTIMALTPSLLVTALLDAFSLQIPLAFLLRALLTMGYLSFALQAALGPENPPDDDDG